MEEKRRRQRTSPSRCGYPPGVPGARASSSQARPSQRRRGIPTCARRRAVFQLHGRGRGYGCCPPMGAWGRGLGSTCGVCGLLFVPRPAAVTQGYRCLGGERYRQETEERDYRGTTIEDRETRDTRTRRQNKQRRNRGERKQTRYRLKPETEESENKETETKDKDRRQRCTDRDSERRRQYER